MLGWIGLLMMVVGICKIAVAQMFHSLYSFGAVDWKGRIRNVTAYSGVLVKNRPQSIRELSEHYLSTIRRILKNY